jgi:hypothetical protein
MKRLLLLILIIIGGVSVNAQDKYATPIEIKPTELGFEIDYACVFLNVDTVHHTTQVHSVYHKKMYFCVNGGRATLLKRGEAITVWSNHFTLVVTNRVKKHKKHKIPFKETFKI